MRPLRSIAFLAAVACVFFTAAATPVSAFLFGGDAAGAAGDSGAPIAQSLEVETYRNIPYTGTLSAVDNEGDAFTFAIAEAPKKGDVVLGADGVSFYYIPNEGESGQDSFTYTATDTQGNVSAPATVRITIIKQRTAVTYADLAGHPSAPAAVCLAEHGVYVGRQVGSSWFFDPEETVTRSEFLAMAMEALGSGADEGVQLTGFADDESIAAWAKGYATAAVREGVISGVSTAEGIQFQGEDAITLSEAATVMNRLMDVTDVRLEEGAAETWADQAVANMESVSVVAAGSFGTSAVEQPVTRAQAAEMLNAAIRLTEEETGGGLFGWF